MKGTVSWTSTPPYRPGFYWTSVRLRGGPPNYEDKDVPVVVHVTIEDGKRLVLWLHHMDYSVPLPLTVARDDYKVWAGPIKPPGDGE